MCLRPPALKSRVTDSVDGKTGELAAEVSAESVSGERRQDDVQAGKKNEGY